jgi:type I pantothenate kinase
LSEDEAKAMALDVWREINKKNLHRNILPTRERANLILHKGKDQKVDFVKLRK